jgi:crossover junction endodeoxyribonuclease RusA
MLNDVVLHLPWPPSVNNYYKTGRSGQRYLALRVREYRAAVLESVSEQAPGLCLDERLFMEVYLFAPTRREYDVDNMMKGLLDALTEAGLWTDDKLVDQLHIYRGVLVKGGSVRIELSEGGPLCGYE